jgi:hypothetical protein
MFLEQVVSFNSKAYNAFLYLGIIYKEKNESDSALFYLNKALDSKDIGQQSTAYLHLSQLSEINGDKRKATFLQRKHKNLQDSINTITRTEEVERYHMLYRFQRSEKENDVLKLTNERKQSQIYLLLLSLSFTLVILNVILFHLIKKKREIQIQAEKFRKYSLQQKALSTANIKENKERIKQLEIELESSQTQKDTLHNQLLLTQRSYWKLQISKVKLSKQIKTYNALFFIKQTFTSFFIKLKQD